MTRATFLAWQRVVSRFHPSSVVRWQAMSITIKNLRVRAKKRPVNVACGPELTKMLGCWAATGDLQSMSTCQQHAQDLYECMRSPPVGKGTHRPTINYHLARLSKKMQ